MVDQFNLIGLDPTQVLRALKKWLVDHVQGQDRSMAQFLQSLPTQE
jgi:hemerythrin